MAIFLTEEDKKKTGGSFSTASAPQGGSGDSKGGPAMSKSPSQRGSGFTNVGSYLDANRGAGQKMGTSFREDLSNDFDSEVGSLKESGKDQMKFKRGNYADNNYFNKDSFSKNDFDKYYDQGKNEKSYEDRGTDVFSDFSKNIGSYEGRKTELADMYGDGSYGQGMKSLDSIFLGPQARNLSNQASGFQSRYDGEQSRQRSNFKNEQARANRDIDRSERQFKGLFENARSNARGDLNSLYRSERSGDDYVQEGEAAEDKLRALGSLIGQDTAGYDFEALSSGRIAAADAAKAAQLKEAEDEKVAAVSSSARKVPSKYGEYSNKLQTGVSDPLGATMTNANNAGKDISKGGKKLKKQISSWF